MAVETTETITLLLERAAKLSRIAMTPADLAELAPQAQKIFAAFDKLSELDTQGVEPLYTFREAIELRADEATSILDSHKLLAEAPESESGHFVVPRVMGGDDVF